MWRDNVAKVDEHALTALLGPVQRHAVESRHVEEIELGAHSAEVRERLAQVVDYVELDLIFDPPLLTVDTVAGA